MVKLQSKTGGVIRIFPVPLITPSITQSIKAICYFLMQINGLTDKYAREFITNIDQADLSYTLNRIATLLMDSPQEIESAYQSAMLEYKRLKSVTSTSLSFFNTKKTGCVVEEDRDIKLGMF